jgi:hypothetical protein
MGTGKLSFPAEVEVYDRGHGTHFALMKCVWVEGNSHLELLNFGEVVSIALEALFTHTSIDLAPGGPPTKQAQRG